MDLMKNVADICWRTERADRFAVVIDAENYFRALRNVVPKAQNTIIFVGWDFDTRIDLDPECEDDGYPLKFGQFLDQISDERPDLNMYILKWNLGTLKTLGRGSTPLKVFDLMTDKNISIRMDHHHPTGSAHHQKIAVIDDTLAFCGGIDVTAERWDTREHLDENAHRLRPTSGRPYGPWHDATIAVTGDAARALGILARRRWQEATDDKIPMSEGYPRIWPDNVPVMLKDVDVGICRTIPAYRDREPVREIEEMTHSIIAGAQKWLYIENQYFASRALADAIMERLAEPEGPEIVIVNPESADGWLEEKVMGTARASLLDDIRKNDPHDRFRAYTPVAKEGTPIYVHSKIVIADLDLLKLGSSNFNNRSMGFDTECDLVLTAVGQADPDEVAEAITALRTDLMAEHLGKDAQTVRERIDAENGSIIATIDGLRGEGRSLRPLEPSGHGPIARALFGEDNILDPKGNGDEAEPMRADEDA